MEVQDVITQTRDALTVRKVFGEPYEKNGVTMIRSPGSKAAPAEEAASVPRDRVRVPGAASA